MTRLITEDLEATCPECGLPLPLPRFVSMRRHPECQIIFKRRYEKLRKREIARERREKEARKVARKQEVGS